MNVVPQKICINGMIRGGERLDIIDPTPDDLDNFSIDGNGPVPEEHQVVAVPDTLCPLNDCEKADFLKGISYLQTDDTDFGRSNFCAAKQLLNEILEHHESNSTIYL